MRSTLFYIPHSFGPLTVWGFGWALIAFVITIAAVVFVRRSQGQSIGKATEDWISWAIVAAVVAFVVPNLETWYPTAEGHYPVGLPVRGYGIMLMLGVSSGVLIAYSNAKKVGITIDQMLSLAFWVIITGIVGARLFFVVQKWSELDGDTAFEKLGVALKFTEGGLVVYGAVIGGVIAGMTWAYARKISPFLLADIMTPGFLLGLAFGRIGCLLNGCCYGGVCEMNLPTVTFPQGSPPYMDQLASGKLLGIETASAPQSVTTDQPDAPRFRPKQIVSIKSGSWAEKAGLKTGSKLNPIGLKTYPPLPESDPAGPPIVDADIVVDGRPVSNMAPLPKRSLPTHPSQIYATINALLLCAVLYYLFSAVDYNGIVFAVGWILYGVSRMLEEWIRVDEAGQFGTSLSIAQWISICGIIAGIIVLVIPKSQRTTVQVA